MNNIQKFIGLIEEQCSYGGLKYSSKTDSKREATDDLFDDFGKNWLYGTMAKYCKRYENLLESIPAKSERDLLKIGTYCYILWLKRGFFVSEQGIDSPVVTLNVALKQKYFGDFISVVSTPEPLKKILSALGIYSDEVPNYRLLYLKLKEYANKDWKQLSEFDIKLAFHLVYQEWNNRFGHLETHDTDTLRK